MKKPTLKTRIPFATLALALGACGQFHLPETISPSQLLSNEGRDFDDVPLSGRHYNRLDLYAMERDLTGILEEATAEEAPPSVVYAVGDDRGLILQGAHGYARLEPGQAQPATLGTMYDLASLTKVVATTTAVMQLWERGLIDLDDPIVEYLPDYANNGKEAITIRQCLTHTAGFRPFYRLWTEVESPEEARAFLANCALEYTPGTEYRYSDVGFVTLGWLVQAVSGQRLDEYCQQSIFQPLGMGRTMFTPPPGLHPLCAATEYDGVLRQRVVQGEVHDENAHFLGGVAGHAGLFSTVEDLTHFTTMLLNGGEFRGQRILRPETIAEMRRVQIDMLDTDGDVVRRGLGWWLRDGGGFLGSCGGEAFPASTFGHTGFTGTAIQIDPERQVYAIFLANRVHARSGEWTNPDFRSESYARFRPVRVAFFNTVAETFH